MLKESQYLNSLLQNLDQARTTGIDYALEKHQLDVLFFPGFKGADIAARASYPSVVVPAGYTLEGKPIRVQFTGTAYSEAMLMRAGYAFEQKTKYQNPPQLDLYKAQ